MQHHLVVVCLYSFSGTAHWENGPTAKNPTTYHPLRLIVMKRTTGIFSNRCDVAVQDYDNGGEIVHPAANEPYSLGVNSNFAQAYLIYAVLSICNPFKSTLELSLNCRNWVFQVVC